MLSVNFLCQVERLMVISFVESDSFVARVKPQILVRLHHLIALLLPT